MCSMPSDIAKTRRLWRKGGSHLTEDVPLCPYLEQSQSNSGTRMGCPPILPPTTLCHSLTVRYRAGQEASEKDKTPLVVLWNHAMVKKNRGKSVIQWT